MAKRNFDATNRDDTSKKQKNSEVFNLEENYLMPSLQHVSMSKVAIALWNQTDIKYQLVKYFSECEQISPLDRELSYREYSYLDNKFQLIVDKVLKNLLQLALPNRVRKMLSNIIHPIGSEIFVWIKYQDDYVFLDLDFREEKNIAVNHIDDLVWTPRGRIDYKETAKALLEKRRISCDLYKYNIACEHCLEDDIAIIAPKVINTSLNLESIYSQPMLYFWTAHITGDFTELDVEVASYNRVHSTNYTANECLFKVLIEYGPNEVAIKYIWDKLNNEEKSRQIAAAIANTSNNDFRCFLLSKIRKEQETEVFKRCKASQILLHFLGDWLWGHCFLPTLHNIWHLMHGYDYGAVLQGIVIKMENSHEDIAKYSEYKATFKEVWKWAPKHLKDCIFEENDGYFGHYVFFELFDKKNIDIIQSILFDLNDAQKKAIIFSGLSWRFRSELYFDLITSDQLDLIEWLIGSTLFCSEDVERFKWELMYNESAQTMIDYFIRDKEFDEVQQFLEWAFKSDHDIRVFKIKLASTSKICPNMLECIIENKNTNFEELEYFLEWCASGNAEGVIELKKNMLERRDCFDTVICKLIQEDKYELLEQILDFCFVNDQKRVTQFKQYLYQDDQIYKIKDLIVHLIKQDDQLQSLKKFVYYCGATDEEINKFKTCILHPKEGT